MCSSLKFSSWSSIPSLRRRWSTNLVFDLFSNRMGRIDCKISDYVPDFFLAHHWLHYNFRDWNGVDTEESVEVDRPLTHYPHVSQSFDTNSDVSHITWGVAYMARIADQNRVHATEHIAIQISFSKWLFHELREKQSLLLHSTCHCKVEVELFMELVWTSGGILIAVFTDSQHAPKTYQRTVDIDQRTITSLRFASCEGYSFYHKSAAQRLWWRS